MANEPFPGGFLPPAAPAPSPSAPDPRPEPRPGVLRRVLGPLLVALVAIAKYAKVALLALPKLKLLTTSGSMLVSVGAYALIWGWKFAVGFVLLLFVHEMGHVLQLRREGIPASAPLFIPFLGAVVGAKSLGDDAAAEARVGLAGPVLGTLAAAACVPLYALTGNELFLALAFTGFFLNLFNLLPVTPLDGGRAMAALSPWMWFAGLFGVALLAFWRPNPIIFLILLFAGFDTYRRWKAYRSGDEDVRRYYSLTRRQRAAVGVVYLGLVVALVIGMDLTHVQRTFADA
jgi:Zn-dependent protease